jgi:hypothetical protein
MEGFDAKMAILSLGAPPRRISPLSIGRLPRASGMGLVVFVLVFGLLAAGAGLAMTGGSMSDRDKAPLVGGMGLVMTGVAVWQFMKKRSLRETLGEVIQDGRATMGFVKSLRVDQVNNVIRDHYEFEYQDESKARRTLKAFYVSPEMRAPEGSMVVVLYDPKAPERAGIFPLDYPDLRLDPPQVGPGRSSDEDIISKLGEVGAPLNFGDSAPEDAFIGGVVKAGLYHGIKKMEEGDLKAAIESFDAVWSTAERGNASPGLRAVIRAQRGTAYARLGNAELAKADFEAACALDPTLGAPRAPGWMV